MKVWCHSIKLKLLGSGTFSAILAGTIQIKKFSASIEAPLSRVQIVHGLVDSSGNELEEVEGTLQTLALMVFLSYKSQREI